MTSTHGSDSSCSQSTLPSPLNKYSDCSKNNKFEYNESDSGCSSVATSEVKVSRGSRRKQSLKLPVNRYRQDDAKKLADQRWRQSINDCYDVLRDYADKDIVFHDGTILKGKECRSRNDLLAKTIDLIGELESFFSDLCKRQPDSLHVKNSVTSSREKFLNDKMQVKPKNLSMQQ